MIILRSKRELQILRDSNRIAVEVLSELKKKVIAGVTTLELDRLTEKLIRGKRAEPAFKGYRGFPASLCTSVNEEIVHGIPGTRVLREGDIISLDLGVRYAGFFGDVAVTLPVGKVSEEKQRLIEVTREALERAVKVARPDNRLSDISHTVQTWVEENGFSVVREFVGHGIGSSLHEEPQIPNFGPPDHGPRLGAGMVLAIEPMVNAGDYEVEIMEDNWTARTKDGSPSAHFEYVVAITENGPEILTSKQ